MKQGGGEGTVENTTMIKINLLICACLNLWPHKSSRSQVVGNQYPLKDSKDLDPQDSHSGVILYPQVSPGFEGSFLANKM